MTQHPNPTIEDIIAQMPEGLQAMEGRGLIRRAYQFALEAHEGQARKSGEPYIVHPLHVAYLLAEMHFEPAVIAAGLLHDVLEDCRDKGVDRAKVEDLFGSEVLILVEGVTKLEWVEKRAGGDQERVRDLHELESLRKLLISMAEDDIRIIFVKLADRLHNMRTLQHLPPDRQTRMARETLEIFAPVANRLGIWVWKAEFEDIAFRYLNRSVYDQLSELMNSRRDERQDRVATHIQILNKALAEEGVPVSVKGRPKHFYSIYRKMRRKHVPFAQIYDVEGLRVLVDADIPLNLPEDVLEEDEAFKEVLKAAERERDRKEAALCYRVLGVVHGLWKPVPGEFDDYIANPKPNGYQSLHTAVIGEDGQALEIQIRTRRMHRVAEYGVAAHWRYKESNVSLSAKMMEQIARVWQSVHELTEEVGDARDFIDTIRSDVFQERVYVFTPQGRVIDLPVGATPVDFAYYVHTEVGHQCRGARVNGRWTPLDYELQTGDQVKIIVNRGGGPSRHWLDEDLGFVRTSRARQKIRRWFRQKSREENAAQGRLMADKLLRRLNLPYTMEEIGDIFHKRYQNIDDLFTAIAVGDVDSEEFVSRLEDYARHQKEEEIADLEKSGPPPPLSEEIATGVTVQGTGGLLTQIAKCCKPLPGEDIVGYVTRGRGVTIHRQDCPNILRIQSDDEERERLIAVDWGTAKQRTFPVQVRVNVYDRTGLLHDISGVLKRHGINMDAVSTGKRNQDNVLPLYLTLEVPDFATLTRVLRRVEQITNVISTRRIS